MDTTQNVLTILDESLKKENKDLFDNRIDIRYVFNNTNISSLDVDLMKGVCIILEKYEISILRCEDLGDFVFKYMFHDFSKDYFYSSLNIEDFIKNVKEYIPYAIVDMIDSSFIQGWSHVLYRN